jgi:RNA polymerase sigma factor (TIGR02999 family)
MQAAGSPHVTPSPAPGISHALGSIYPELRRIARALMSTERSSHTLQPTALANEAVLRLLRREIAGWDSRRLVIYGIREMRCILVDSGRRLRTRLKHSHAESPGGGLDDRLADLVHLELALKELGKIDPRACKVVELRFFVGLTNEEVAAYLGVSMRTVQENWQFARCWLARHWAEVSIR